MKINGDKALLKYEKKFNSNKVIAPSSKQISKQIKLLNKKVKRAIDLAYERTYKFHSLQRSKNISYTDKLNNKLEYKYIPIESVAIYVPGSNVSYPSSVLMNAIPAIIAGVKRIVMINPGYKGKRQQFYMLQKNVRLKKYTHWVDHQLLQLHLLELKNLK